jgi:GTPase
MYVLRHNRRSAIRSARLLSSRPAWTQWKPPTGGAVLTPADEAAMTVQHEEFTSPRAAHTLRCCLIGPTNAGKSTMLNRLVNSNVSIVSDKIHTTRENTVGFMTDTRASHRPTQVEFVDAPGALGPHVPVLQREMWEAVRSTDLALVVVDASDGRRFDALGRFLSQLGERLDAQQADDGRRTETVLVLNKVDRVKPKTRLLEMSARMHKRHRFDWPCLMVSALKNDGMEDLKNWLLLHAKPGEWAVPEGVRHVQSPLQVATEIIRANIFRCCKDELPYLISQRNVGWTELPNGDLRIDQELVAPPRRSTQAIVQKRMAGIGKLARQQISAALGRNVHLFLSVGSAASGDAELTPLEVVGHASRVPGR